MKDKHIFYAVCLIALIGLGVICIGYATELLPRYKQNSTKTGEITTTEKSQVIVDIPENQRGTTQLAATVEKKKDCHCCKERMEKARERLAQLREKRRQSKLLKEHK